MTEKDGKAILAELVSGLKNVPEGPWRNGGFMFDSEHVVDFGPPPHSPFMLIKGIAYSDSGNSSAIGNHVRRTYPAAIRAIAAYVSELEAENERLRGGLNVLANTFYKDDQHQAYAKHILGDPNGDGNGQG